MTIDAQKRVGTTLAGRYEVTGVLGAGGMGVVLEARQIAMDRKVAVKLLQPGFALNRHAVARFVREMQVTSRLEHAGTVRVYDFGETTDADGVHLFLVMELLQGRTLGKVLGEDGPLSHARSVAIARQIARALEAAHGEGIVHRDLKPDNVMLVDRYGQADVVKVLDFGIARFVDGAEGDGVGKLTAEGAVVGTPAYMSPEQATGAEIGPASDLYSLGVMLFEMTTGCVPFSAPTTVSLMVKHVQELPPRPTDLAPMPATLEALILSCLAKSPDLRPSSAKMLAEALETLGRQLGTNGDEPGARALQRPSYRLRLPAGWPVDTARTGAATAASEAETARRIEQDAELPPPAGRKPWWILAAAAVIAAGVAVAVLGNKGDRGRTTVTPATRIAPATPLADAGEVRAHPGEPGAANAIVDLAHGEPPAPPGCSGGAVAKARAALAAHAGDALTLAQEGVRACPAWALAHVVLGQAAQADTAIRPEAWGTARAAFQRARELAPAWGLPQFDLALVELAAGDPEAARAALLRLLELAPDWPNARLLKAQVELTRGDYTTAKVDAEAATTATPERAEAWFLLGESQRALGAAGSPVAAKNAYCKAKALGMSAAIARCDAAP